MPAFDLKSVGSALTDSNSVGVDFSGKSLKLDTKEDAKPIVEAIKSCKDLTTLNLRGNTLGVPAAEEIAMALEDHPEFKHAQWSDLFTGRMKTEIPPALSALGDSMIKAGAKLTVLDLSDNAFGPIGVQGLAKLLESEVCSELQELYLNNNGLGIAGGKLLAKALSGKSAPRLKVFIAGRNRLENEGATVLADVFEKMGSLEKIAMPQNGIYHVGITALSRAFKSNKNLKVLNLNDNTIGPKGAKAFANALPQLKALKDINFGDCLLKSKGALELAKAIKDNQILLEALDLSHNEIGSAAVSELVSSITVLPESSRTFKKVILAGNSLGGSSKKQDIKQKIGPTAELSDGESDDEDVSDEEESEDQSEEDQDTEPETTAEDSHVIEEVVIDTSGIEDIQNEVENFLKYPTKENFMALGSEAADVIDVHLNSTKDPSLLITAYVDAIFKVSGLSTPDSDPHIAETAKKLYLILFRSTAQQHAVKWALADAMLVGLRLMKTETKNSQICWNLDGCFSVLSTVIKEPDFPAALKDTILFFMKSKKDRLSSQCQQDFNL